MERTFPERRTCGTMAVHERLLRTHPEYGQNLQRLDRFTEEYAKRNFRAGLRSEIVVIPVVVHVVYNTTAQNIADAQIQSQIDILNLDYRRLNADAGSVPAAFAPVAADPRIQFQLAVRDPNCQPTNGITRTHTTTATFTDDNQVKSSATGGADPWPSDRYLNLWVCPLDSGGLLGYAQFPGGPANTDGVVINYQAFGNTGTATAPFNRGRTATHEIGHWLNLHHLWGDGGNNSSCTADDFVADTPKQSGPNFGCPTFPHVTCSNGPNGDMFMNYMDYVDDACMFMFSTDQATRMAAAIAGARASIAASDALIPPAASTPVLWSADTPEDTGVEPDPVADVMYASSDIWVRNQNDGVTNQEHQNPIYRAPGTGSNYVYVRVRNRACGGSGSGTVKLYWAKASSALGWPAPWDGSVTTPALMGHLIDSKPTGSVSGGGSTILEFPWYPPNPADYSSFGADKAHFCLLSRIETSSTPPYGMTTPEGPDLNANVRNNNKIVWKNVEVMTPGSRIGYLTINNLEKEAALFELAFPAPHERTFGSLFATMEVSVELDGKLFEAWKHGGSKGNGIAVGKGNQIIVKEYGASLGNIKLARHEVHTVAVHFDPKHTQQRTNIFFFIVEQREIRGGKQTMIGGQRFVIKTLGTVAQPNR